MDSLSAHWVLDRDYLDNCYGDIEQNPMTSALEKLSTPYQIVHWRNRLFTDGFEVSDDPAVIYFAVGSVSFCRKIGDVLGEKVDMGRVFCLLPNEVVNYSHYIHMVAPELRLNQFGTLMPLGEIRTLGEARLKQLLQPDCSAGVFLKCDYGLKSAESEYVEWGDLSRWCDYTETHTGCSRNSLFWLFPKRQFCKEFRFAIVDGVVVSGTQYMDFDVSKTTPTLSSSYPVKAKLAAELILQQLTVTDDAYILDLAEVDGDYKLVECNAISSSGWYEMDHVALCRVLSQKVISIHTEYLE